MPRRTKRFELSSLARGMEGLSPAKGGELAEAAGVCLDHHRHPSGVRLTVSGELRSSSQLDFEAPSEQARRSHGDLQEATESGACAVAIVVVCAETGLQVVDRARKGTGVDYWLGRSIGVFEARLEVSGILAGTEAQIDSRVHQKLEQMTRSDEGGLPGYAAVVEFSHPRVHVESK